MKLRQTILAAVLLGSVAACTVVPAYPVGYRAAPVYVESYPAYRSGYYRYDQPRYADRDSRYYRDQGRYQQPQRMELPLESTIEVHRDIRRSLGLPRLPGMP